MWNQREIFFPMTKNSQLWGYILLILTDSRILEGLGQMAAVPHMTTCNKHQMELFIYVFKVHFSFVKTAGHMHKKRTKNNKICKRLLILIDPIVPN